MAVLVFASSAVAATVIPVGEFRSVELRNGGHVIVRHGAVQRVSVVTGDPESVRVRVGDDQRLIVENTGRAHRRGERLQLEVVTPRLSAVAVSNGGLVQALGAFPAQSSIDAAVEQGGAIDIRPIAADSVNASVYSGGRIFTTARKSLAAAVDSGGGITYWGDVRDVKKSVRNGGAVTRGKAADAEKPLPGLGDELPAVPPVPVIPPRQ